MPKEIKAASSHRTSPIAVTADSTSQTRQASTWTAADDGILKQARASGLNWQLIASKHFPLKTANACRKRHERLMERSHAKEWDGVKLETLAKEYMNVRREMWSILASRVGERWQLVETKCMEKGLKNLQSAHRSAQRKERGMGEGDSGIGCSDAENEIDEGQAGVEQAAQQLQKFRTQRGGLSIQSMLSPDPAYPDAAGHSSGSTSMAVQQK